MPRLAKTASAAIAALVVAGSAAAAATVSPPSAGPARASASRAAPAPAGPGVVDAASVSPSVAAGSGRPGLVLFVGGSPSLLPRGGAARSFACRAVAALELQCSVRRDADPGAGWPASVDLVVVAAGPRDDGPAVQRSLDALPARLRTAAVVVLGPVTSGGSARTAAQLAGLRRLAAARGAGFVDPVAGRWVTASTRARYLSADGVLTAAGHQYVAGLLARALAGFGPAGRTRRPAG